MKKLFFLCCLLITSFVGNSQSNNRLQGPKAKNAKPWNNKKKKPQLVTIQNRETLKGPAAKNSKPWQRKYQTQPIQSLALSRRQIKGPKAKNYKFKQLKWVSSSNEWVEVESPEKEN